MCDSTTDTSCANLNINSSQQGQGEGSSKVSETLNYPRSPKPIFVKNVTDVDSTLDSLLVHIPELRVSLDYVEHIAYDLRCYKSDSKGETLETIIQLINVSKSSEKNIRRMVELASILEGMKTVMK